MKAKTAINWIKLYMSYEQNMMALAILQLCLTLVMLSHGCHGNYFLTPSCGAGACTVGDYVLLTETSSEIRCAMKCFQEQQCLSYSYTEEKFSANTCQLVYSDTDDNRVFGCYHPETAISFKVGLYVSLFATE